MNSGRPWRLGHRPALDGLRGVAILLVLAGHASHGWLYNFGSVGVNVFFALSGFLITALLVAEGGSRGRISLRAFYGRRARRLLPALGLYLGVIVALSLAGAAFFRLTFSDVWPVLAYVQNWAMVVHNQGPSTVAITWSLSIEEQFYLLWPLVLIAGLRWRWLPWTVGALGITYALTVRLLVWNVPGAAWALYYRSDTHMDPLLIGCLLALTVSRFGVPAWSRYAFLTGVGGLVLLLVSDSSWLRVAMEPAGVAVATSAMIVATLANRGRLLAWSPLRWVGRRSYALYLWHYPLAALAWGGTIPMWLAIVLAFTFAELSWWAVERPLRRSPGSEVGGDLGPGQDGRVVGHVVNLPQPVGVYVPAE